MKSIFIFLLLLPMFVFAQAKESFMYSNGRIYVVIAVLLIIFFGLILYLFRIERKIKKLEQQDKVV